MSWHHCLTDELAKELVDGIDLINLPSATFLPSGTNFAPMDEIMT
jgi:hypothetical protein